MSLKLDKQRTVTLIVVGSGLVTALVTGVLIGLDEERLATLLVLGAALALMIVTTPRWVVFIGGALVFAGGFSLVGIPLPEVGAVLITLGVLIGKRSGWCLPLPLLLTAALLFAWLVFVAFGQFDEAGVIKRLTSLLVWLAVLVAVALPGAFRLWLARGLLLGLVISLPAGALLGSTYGNRLAGLVGDPNAFALVVAMTVPLIVFDLRLSRRVSMLVWLLGAVLAVAADSRTGMLALTTAAVVYLLLPRIRGWAMGVPYAALWIAGNLPEDFVRGGRWEERLGSDELRQRIDAASTRQIEENLWTGRGLGEGKVDLATYGDPPQELVFFLHNSYKSLITETGLVGVGLYAVLALGAVVEGLRGTLARGALAGMAAGAVMATQLGEVLFAIPAALALGLAWGSTPAISPNGARGWQHSAKELPGKLANHRG